jgi:hypothetical protein
MSTVLAAMAVALAVAVAAIAIAQDVMGWIVHIVSPDSSRL